MLRVEFDGIEIQGVYHIFGAYTYDLTLFGLGTMEYNSEGDIVKFSIIRRVNIYHNQHVEMVSSVKCIEMSMSPNTRIAVPANDKPGSVVLTLA